MASLPNMLEILSGQSRQQRASKGNIHIIGERSDAGHHNFFAYITAAKAEKWNQTSEVDHNMTRVVSRISDTVLTPKVAIEETVGILDHLFTHSSSLLIAPSVP